MERGNSSSLRMVKSRMCTGNIATTTCFLMSIVMSIVMSTTKWCCTHMHGIPTPNIITTSVARFTAMARTVATSRPVHHPRRRQRRRMRPRARTAPLCPVRMVECHYVIAGIRMRISAMITTTPTPRIVDVRVLLRRQQTQRDVQSVSPHRLLAASYQRTNTAG